MSATAVAARDYSAERGPVLGPLQMPVRCHACHGFAAGYVSGIHRTLPICGVCLEARSRPYRPPQPYLRLVTQR